MIEVSCAFTGHRRGGTAATVRYARKEGRRLITVDPINLHVTYSTDK